MAYHDVPQYPGGAAVLHDYVVSGQRVVEQGGLLVLDDNRVGVHKTLGCAGCAAGVEDVERVRVWHALELQLIVWPGPCEKTIQSGKWGNSLG